MRPTTRARNERNERNEIHSIHPARPRARASPPPPGTPGRTHQVANLANEFESRAKKIHNPGRDSVRRDATDATDARDARYFNQKKNPTLAAALADMEVVKMADIVSVCVSCV